MRRMAAAGFVLAWSVVGTVATADGSPGAEAGDGSPPTTVTAPGPDEGDPTPPTTVTAPGPDEGDPTPPTTVAAPGPDVGDVTAPVVRAGVLARWFSPNGDGRTDMTRIRVTLNEPAVLRVVVRNPRGVGRKTLLHRRVPAGQTTVVWRGHLRRPNGRLVKAADGRYDILVEAVDDADNRRAVEREVGVDTRPPVLRAWTPRPEPWSGRGVLVQPFTARDASGSVRTWAQVTSGRRVVAEMAHRIRPSHLNELRWRPRDRGRLLTPGPYEGVVVARDAANNTSRSRPHRFRVHRSGSTQVVQHLSGAGRRVALTIDDCVHRDAWLSIVATLRRLGAGATFFCNGDNVRRWPDVARLTAETPGVSIGSHSSDHAELPNVGYSGTVSRLVSDQAAWWSAARTTPVPYFRPPYGAYNSTVLAAAGAASFPYTVLWTVDPRDWDVSDPATITGRVLSAAKPGVIILLHTKPGTARAMASIITGLRARGLQPVGLHTVLR